MLRLHGKDDKVARQRVEGELKVIEELDFTNYFLITWDIVQYAQTRGYFHIVR
jgi:DNA polymerase III alpha subunit